MLRYRVLSKLMTSMLNLFHRLWDFDTRTAEWLIGNMLLSTTVGLIWGAADDYANLLEVTDLETWILASVVLGAVTYASLLLAHASFLRFVAQLFNTAFFAAMIVIQLKADHPIGVAVYMTFFVSSVYCFVNVASKLPKIRILS